MPVCGRASGNDENRLTSEGDGLPSPGAQGRANSTPTSSVVGGRFAVPSAQGRASPTPTSFQKAGDGLITIRAGFCRACQIRYRQHDIGFLAAFGDASVGIINVNIGGAEAFRPRRDSRAYRRA